MSTDSCDRLISTDDDSASVLRWLTSEQVLGFVGGEGLSVRTAYRVAAWRLRTSMGGSSADWERIGQVRRLLCADHYA